MNPVGDDLVTTRTAQPKASRRQTLLGICMVLSFLRVDPALAAAAASGAARAFLLLAMKERDGARRRAMAVAKIAEYERTERTGSISDRMTLAAAIGVAARQTDPVESLRLRYGSRSIGLIRGVLEVEPDEPWALMMLGLWNFESLRRGGAIAGRMLGATESEGLDSVAAARSLSPEDPALHLAAAVAFASYDAVEYAEAARHALGEVRRLVLKAPGTERDVLSAAAAPLSQALERQDHARARAIALQVM